MHRLYTFVSRKKRAFQIHERARSHYSNKSFHCTYIIGVIRLLGAPPGPAGNCHVPLPTLIVTQDGRYASRGRPRVGVYTPGHPGGPVSLFRTSGGKWSRIVAPRHVRLSPSRRGAASRMHARVLKLTMRRRGKGERGGAR